MEEDNDGDRYERTADIQRDLIAINDAVSLHPEQDIADHADDNVSFAQLGMFTYSCLHTHRNILIHTYSYIHHTYIIHTYIHTRIRAYIHTYIHSNEYTYIQMNIHTFK